jgi:hypothetical protein
MPGCPAPWILRHTGTASALECSSENLSTNGRRTIPNLESGGRLNVEFFVQKSMVVTVISFQCDGTTIPILWTELRVGKDHRWELQQFHGNGERTSNIFKPTRNLCVHCDQWRFQKSSPSDILPCLLSINLGGLGAQSKVKKHAATNRQCVKQIRGLRGFVHPSFHASITALPELQHRNSGTRPSQH